MFEFPLNEVHAPQDPPNGFCLYCQAYEDGAGFADWLIVQVENDPLGGVVDVTDTLPPEIQYTDIDCPGAMKVDPALSVTRSDITPLFHAWSAAPRNVEEVDDVEVEYCDAPLQSSWTVNGAIPPVHETVPPHDVPTTTPDPGSNE